MTGEVKIIEPIYAEEDKKWADLNEVVKVFKLSDKSFGWTHLIIARRKEGGKLYLRLKKWGASFNINSEKHLVAVLNALDKGAEELKWMNELTDAKLDELVEENKQLRDKTIKTKKQLSRKKEVVDKLIQQVGKLREEQLNASLIQFENDLEKFRSLLDNGASEKELQEWLFECQWIFGPGYLEGSREELTREGNKIDFLLQRYDTFYDIIELKLPSCPLFVGQETTNPQQAISRTYTISGELKDAISQVLGYLEQYGLDRANEFITTGRDLYKLNGIIVIGRTNNDQKRALKTVNSYLHGITILTFDDLLKMAENFIKLIKSNKNKMKKVGEKNVASGIKVES